MLIRDGSVGSDFVHSFNGFEPSEPKGFVFSASCSMPSWLRSEGISLAFTTYQIGKVFLVGTADNGRLVFSERTFPRVMGLGVHKNGFWLGSQYQLWRFDNYLSSGASYKGCDALYVPSLSFTTGDVDIHDIHDLDSSPVFVATRFNCLAEPAQGKSFRAVWKPPFIDRLAAEDRCHLNGMAVAGGSPQFVTCVSQSNVSEGWREHRSSGGAVIDVESGDVVSNGLSMPHSPRIHDGRLWIIQSGTGELGTVDIVDGRFEPVCFLPGFARGLSIHGDRAVVGVSMPRNNDKTFSGLPLDDRLSKERVAPRCMIAVVNLRTGNLENWIEVSPPVSEIYDVAVIPLVSRPYLVGIRNDDISLIVNADAGSAFESRI